MYHNHIWVDDSLLTNFAFSFREQTKIFYEYENANTPGHWFQVQYTNEEGQDPTCSKTGDGTVPYHSLSWAHTWLGSKGSSVRVTQTPQSVYFSAENITRVRAVRHASTHHAEYALLNGNLPICETDTESSSFSGGTASFFAGLFGPLNRDRITFFESAKEVDGATHSVRTFKIALHVCFLVSACSSLQYSCSGVSYLQTGVWEIDGVGHRDILSNPAFLRELRAELRHIFNGKTNSDKVCQSSVFNEVAEHCQTNNALNGAVHVVISSAGHRRRLLLELSPCALRVPRVL